MTLRIDKLSEIDSKFKRDLVDAYGKKFKKVLPTIKCATSEVIGIRPETFTDYYYPSVTSKTQIVYHFTAGVLHGSIGELTKQHVSVPYVLARDGTIYELHDPKFWSYHLGPSSHYSNKERSGASIGIEIDNIGPLTLKADGTLYDIYDKGYCLATDTASYDKVEYRGYHYFAKFTEAQYKALKDLTTQLTSKYKIPYQFIEPAKRFDFFPSVPKTGIVTHANYRSDKYDLAPNFDFNKVAK